MRLIPEIIKRAFQKPFTIKYPYERPDIPETFRGKHFWHDKLCIMCLQCERICPVGAISIDRDKREYVVDFGKCIFCGMCQEVCPTGAVKLTKRFEMATPDKSQTREKL